MSQAASIARSRRADLVEASSTDDQVTGKPWTRNDTLALVLITLLAGVVRWVGLGNPPAIVFDEHYAQEACLFALGPAGHCPIVNEIGSVHPPLAKWLIAVPIRIFGFSPTAWRLAPLVAGTLSIAVLYLLARRLSGSTIAASVAAGLLSLDFLHYVMSRTAMLDIFVLLFGTASVLFVVYDGDRVATGNAKEAVSTPRRIFQRPWLIAAGVAGGAAIGSKWSGAYVFGGAILLALALTIGRAHTRNWSSADSVREGVAILGCLAALPLGIYAMSYIGRLSGTLWAYPWASDSWVHAFIAQHDMMLEHHRGSLYIHPYTSSPWTWPLIKRPVLFHFRPREMGYQEILALGNPLAWWAALGALASAAWHAIRSRRMASTGGIAIIGFMTAYLPWFLITRQEAFLYYFLPAVPFMYLAVAHVLAGVRARLVELGASAALMAATVGMFAFFWPVLAARPLTYHQWERRMLFQDCGSIELQRQKRPVNQVVPPPRGWCWI